VLLDPGRDGQDIRIEDDVLRRKAGLLDEQFIGALADRDLAFGGVGLARLVEGHHDDARAEAPDDAGLREKILFTFLQRVGAVDHDRNARHFGLAGDEIQEARHRRFGIEHAFVHVHVEQVRAAAHLIERNLEGRVVVVGLDELSETR